MFLKRDLSVSTLTFKRQPHKMVKHTKNNSSAFADFILVHIFQKHAGILKLRKRTEIKKMFQNNQQTFICSESIIETLKKSMTYVQSWQEFRRSGGIIVAFERMSQLFFRVSILDFEQVTICWVSSVFA